MDHIASERDLRYQNLYNEPRGQEFISLQHIMQQDSQKWSTRKGHTLLRTFSSGPLSRVLPSSIAHVISTVLESADFVFENERQASSAADLSTIVSRQDHMAVH